MPSHSIALASTAPDQLTPAPRHCSGGSSKCTISLVVFRLGKMPVTLSKLPLHQPTNDGAIKSPSNPFQNADVRFGSKAAIFCLGTRRRIYPRGGLARPQRLTFRK